MGLDVSNHQFPPGINWTNVRSSGRTFAWAKATEGTGFVDAYIDSNATNAKNANVLIGAYHYARYDSNPGTGGADLEAAHFWSVASKYIKGGGFYLMPMLDVEASTTGQTKAGLSAWVNEWCLSVSNSAAAAGIIIKPVIYASSSFASTWFDSTVTKWTPWIAAWNSSDPQTSGPSSTAPWSTWTLWQNSSTASVPGVSGNCDVDVFNGTSNTLQTLVITVGDNSSVVSSSVPISVTTGQTFTATITMNNSGSTVWTNTGANPYRLGSQNPSNNTTWGFSRVNLASSPINLGQNAAFTLNATAPMTGGTYAFSWRMLQESTNWFGDTFTVMINVVVPGPGTNFGNYTLDTGNVDPSSYVGSWSANSECSLTVHYTFLGDTNCSQFAREAKWFPGITAAQYSGRGWLQMDAFQGGTFAAANAFYHLRDSNDNDLWKSPAVNQCSFHCQWTTVYSSNLTVSGTGILGGAHLFTTDSGTTSTCGSCGHATVEASQVHLFGARWSYINDWTCLGGYSSASITDTSNRSFNETNLYLYPALDTTHGNVISATMGLNGQTPGRVTTGDCNNANTLDFKTNAAAFGGGDNMDSYGFAWVFAPAGGAQQIVIGSDDGNRLWVNGSLKNSTNAARGLTRDQDRTGAVTFSPGWNRVLFKIHNFSGPFQGTVSLRNGTNVNLNASVNSYDLGGYFSYGLAYEQDAWYPQIVVNNVYGLSSPTNGSIAYGNNTTVSASGASSGQGPVPYWRTMQYQWGNFLGNADSDYADVSGTPTSQNWSNVTTGVTGHRRFHFFALSQSGRTSFQNSGAVGGSTFQDAGNFARYYDVYVDNVPPQTPAFSSATAAGTTQINLAWTVPLDQGVNVDPGNSESAGGAGNQDSQNWYRVGDVGVQVYRNDSVISAWGNGTAMSDTGLAANTPYTYTIEARDNNTAARGAWNNSTGPQGTNIAWTLSVPPDAGSVTPDQASVVYGNGFTWTAVNGFGPAKVQYYRYAWDTSAAHTWTESETQWSSGTLATTPTSAGTWYLHVKGYNGADVANGTFDYAVTVTAGSSTSLIVSSQNPSTETSNVTFTVTVSAVAPATGMPTGLVVFAASDVPFSTNALVAGSASASTTSLPLGTNTVAAQYLGDSNFLGSTNTLQQVVQSATPCSQTNAIVSIVDNRDGTFALTFVGTLQASYYVVATADLTAPPIWTPVAGSTNTATNTGGLWYCTVTNAGPQQFYRSVALQPCP